MRVCVCVCLRQGACTLLRITLEAQADPSAHAQINAACLTDKHTHSHDSVSVLRWNFLFFCLNNSKRKQKRWTSSPLLCVPLSAAMNLSSGLQHVVYLLNPQRPWLDFAHSPPTTNQPSPTPTHTHITQNPSNDA